MRGKWASLVDRIHRETSGPSRKLPKSPNCYRASAEIQAAKPAYADELGFSKSVKLDEIRTHDYALTPGRYVGAEEVEDDGEPIEEKIKRLTATCWSDTI